MDVDQVLAVSREVLATEAQALLDARERLSGAFPRVVRLILERCPPGRVVVMGVGKSGHVGNKIAATLASTGTPAFFVHPTEAGHGDLGMLTAHDVVLAISYSGRSDELLRLIPYFKRNAIPLICLAGQGDSPLASHADFWIDGRVDKEACPLGLAPTSSTTLALALGDALAICLLRLRGFTPEDFAVTHPHGTLGRRLLVTVGDIMLKGPETPAVRPETSIRAALVEMSRGGIGITAITDADGRILGIFTDGDLRRTLDRNVDIRATSVGEVMSPRPAIMRAGQLAVEAVELMERNKVGALLVEDENRRLVGALNMRIVLRAGVV
ncbi:MAG: KpsF/GutQ family sugar-phosphate isomerase [Rhodocyclales bacterium]|nr:KpsF/GutQ family sugar-phosphate isomerase [Rhodocyclales bacterium]